MKKLLTVASFAAIMAFTSQMLYARGGMGDRGPGDCMGPGMGMNHIEMMEKYIDLTDEQADKIHKLDMEFREKAYQSRKDYMNAVDKILTAEQKKKLEEQMMKDHKARMNDRHKDNDKKDRPMKMLPKELNLTTEQIDKIHKTNMEYADKFHKNRKNNDEIKKLAENRNKDIEKVLTEEQIKKLKEFRNNNKGMRDCPFFPEE